MQRNRFEAGQIRSAPVQHIIEISLVKLDHLCVDPVWECGCAGESRSEVRLRASQALEAHFADEFVRTTDFEESKFEPSPWIPAYLVPRNAVEALRSSYHDRKLAKVAAVWADDVGQPVLDVRESLYDAFEYGGLEGVLRVVDAEAFLTDLGAGPSERMCD